jgi:hypothetical protein
VKNEDIGKNKVLTTLSELGVQAYVGRIAAQRNPILKQHSQGHLNLARAADGFVDYS